MSDVDVSIVVPVFDEEDSVGPLHEQIHRAMHGSGRSWQTIFVDDGSRDGTMERLREIARRDPRVVLLRLGRNSGQTAALQAGFEHAEGGVIVTLDGDLQNDPADIPRLLAGIERGHDAVCGWRRQRHDRWLTRRVPSALANRLIGWLTGVALHDNGCTLKAYRADLVRQAALYGDMHRFLAPLLSLSGCHYEEVVVHHRAREHGRSKYGLSRIWKVLLDLLTLKMLLRFIAHPAAWFALLAMPFAAAMAAAVATGLWLHALDRSSLVLPGVALLCCFAAVHLLLAGMFAELVVRVGDYRESHPILVLPTSREGS